LCGGHGGFGFLRLEFRLFGFGFVFRDFAVERSVEEIVEG
jgi:hypothetical protein